MENTNTLLHKLRDLAISLTLALLTVSTFYSISHLIFPLPQFEDFSCEYQNKHCREWGKIIKKHQIKLGELTTKADKSPEVSNELQNQIDQLRSEIDVIEENVSKAKDARDKLLKQMTDKTKSFHLYIAVGMGIAVLLVGLIMPNVPLQIGLTLGGLFILLFEFTTSRFYINDWIRLILLLIAISLIIALSLKFYKNRKSEINI